MTKPSIQHKLIHHAKHTSTMSAVSNGIHNTLCEKEKKILAVDRYSLFKCRKVRIV